VKTLCIITAISIALRLFLFTDVSWWIALLPVLLITHFAAYEFGVKMVHEALDAIKKEAEEAARRTPFILLDRPREEQERIFNRLKENAKRGIGPF
jgi:hypothetical protein